MSAEVANGAPTLPRVRRRPLPPAAYLGFGVLAGMVLVAAIAPFLTPYDPEKTTEATLLAPSSAHWFGTNATGGDVFSRVIFAARLDLLIAVTSVAGSFALATPIGAWIGYSRGWWTGVVMRVMDFIQSFPAFIFAMALVAASGQSILNIILVLGFLNVPIFVRLVRSEVLGLRQRAFVDAARCVGNSDLRLVFRHILPNTLGTALAQASTNVGWALLLTAGLSFVGAGVRPPTPEWGSMISDGAQYIISGSWWASVFPGIALGLTVLGFSLVGEGIRALLDVRGRP
jgi:peptide/nickel transport system permease protein